MTVRQGAFATVEDVPDLVRRSGGTRAPVDPFGPVDGPDPHVAPEGPGRAWPVVDVAVVTAPAVLAGVAGVGWAVPVVAVGVLALVVTDLLRTGRTPAHRLLGLRTVDARTGLPPALRRAATPELRTVDVRRGADPLRLAPRPSAAVPTAAVDPWLGREPGADAAVVLVLDDGTLVPVHGPTVLGRSPVAPAQGSAVRVTDLSRTLSRSHVEVTPVDDGVRVTDLGSANGTAVGLPGAGLELLPGGGSVVVPVGSRLAIGDRTLLVADPSTVVGP